MTEQQQKFLSLAFIKQEKYESISQQIGEKRETLSLWWEELKAEREELSTNRQMWRSKINNQELVKDTFENFQKWYLSADRKCHYCEISEEQTEQLWKLDKGLTKRKRGKVLEIDRKKPKDYMRA